MEQQKQLSMRAETKRCSSWVSMSCSWQQQQQKQYNLFKGTPHFLFHCASIGSTVVARILRGLPGQTLSAVISSIFISGSSDVTFASRGSEVKGTHIPISQIDCIREQLTVICDPSHCKRRLLGRQVSANSSLEMKFM